MSRLAALASLSLLAACSEAEQPAGEAAVPTPENADYDPSQPGAGNEYSYLDLLALRDGDTQLIVDGMDSVGGCSFRTDDDRLLLVVGSPDGEDERGIGAARLNGRGVFRFDAAEAGAAYIDGGPTMVHPGDAKLTEVKLAVTHDRGPGKPAGMETVEWPAKMVVSDPDAERQPYDGTWSCGV